MTKYYRLLIILLLFTACDGRYTYARKNISYTEQTIKQSNIIVLPTDAVVNTIDFAGNSKRMSNYEAHMRELIKKSLVSELQKHGYNAVGLTINDVMEKDIFLQLLKLKQGYNSGVKKLYVKKYMHEKEAYAVNVNIGKQEIDFKNSHKNNLVLLSKFIYNFKTSGARAKDIFIDAFLGTQISHSAEAAEINVGLLDINNGDILWTNIYYDVQPAFHNAFSSKSNVDKEIADKLAKNVLENLFKAK